MYNLSISDKNDVILEIFKSKGILLGSSTINKGIMSHMVGLIDEVRNLNFKDKFASSFGSYGWSGESVNILDDSIGKDGFKVKNKGLKISWNPDDNSIKECIEFGRNYASFYKKIK